MKSIIKPRYLGVLVLFVAAGVALGLAVSGGRSSNPPAAKADAARKAQPDRLTKKVVACGRSGKTICDPTAYKRDRSEGLLALSKPDPHGARPRALRQILPPAWRGKDYGAELMTYGEAHKIAPGLAGASSTLVNPSRKVWVLSLYHHPPISVSDTSWSLPAGVAPRMVRVRVESKTSSRSIPALARRPTSQGQADGQALDGQGWPSGSRRIPGLGRHFPSHAANLLWDCLGFSEARV